jgi:hypothetical protein
MRHPPTCSICGFRDADRRSEMAMDGEGAVSMVWCCQRCDDAADHSLPESVGKLEDRWWLRLVETAVRLNPGESYRHVADIIGLEVSPNCTGAGEQAVRRAIIRLNRKSNSH